MPGLGALGGLLGNAFLEQVVIYNIAGQIIGTALTPYLQALANVMQAQAPNVPLSPAALAELVIRNEMDAGAAADEARMSGTNGERFTRLTKLAGDAPAPEALTEGLRRKFIDQGTWLRGIRQGRLRDEWAPLMQKLAVRDPSPDAALHALLEGQLPEARARELYAEFGGNPEHFQWLYDAQGSAPTPEQAADMARRGIIPWDGTGPDATSFRQAFLEGPWRNKWAAPFQAAAEYLPPARTITAMVREGSLPRDKAAGMLRKLGLTDDLVTAYLNSASSQKTTAVKELAQGTVTALYSDRLISRPDAVQMLQALHYEADEADLILQLADVKVAQRYLESAQSRVHSLYVAHKIGRAAAIAALGRLQMPTDGISDVVGIWDYERAANVRELSPAEVATAAKQSLITIDSALTQLHELGYQPHDAWVYLSIHLKEKLPNEPATDALVPVGLEK